MRSQCRWVLLGCLLMAMPLVGRAAGDLRARYQPAVEALQPEPGATAAVPGTAAATDRMPLVDLVSVGLLSAGGAFLALGVRDLLLTWRSLDDIAEHEHRVPHLSAEAEADAAALRSAQQEWLDRLQARRDRPHRVA